jgi:hypothetical protein
MKILISDAENRKTFDLVNIVLRNYCKKDLLITSSKQNILLKIIYPQLHELRTANYQTFETDLKSILSSIPDSEQIVYLPIEESTTLNFYDFIKKNEDMKKRFIYLLPSPQAFNLSRDKYLLNCFCIENNISAPIIITANEINELKKSNHFKPLIYKPKIGTGSKGIRIIRTMEDLDCVQCDNAHFLQYFVGNGINVCGGFYLMNNGILKSFYSHQRIRTYPPDGGVSIFSKSAQNDEIKEIGTKLLNKLNWSGWAMIEFIYDEENEQYMVIEINPRVWGSILLSEINQSYFVKKYIQLSMNAEIEQPYINNETYIRWLIPWDIILYLKTFGKVKQFWKFNIRNTVYIGFSYTNIFRSLLFILYSTLNIKHFCRIFKRLYL